jgi:hypothetical protein
VIFIAIQKTNIPPFPPVKKYIVPAFAPLAILAVNSPPLNPTKLTTILQQLETLLLDNAPLWQPATFHQRRPDWCTTHPQLTTDLLALDDPSLTHLSQDAQLSATWLQKHLPQLAPLTNLTAPLFPNLQSPISNPPIPKIPARKSAQIQAFTTAVGPPIAPLVEWCAGKAHLSRQFLTTHGGTALAIERNPELCATGTVLARQHSSALKFQTADVLHPATADTLRGAHAIALHACGDLHLRLIQAAAQVRAPAIDLAPCCYQLTAAETYRPISTNSPLKLNRNALKLAVTETITASPANTARSAQASAWKLAFLTLREQINPGAEYQPFHSIPASWTNADFPSFLTKLAEREKIPLPKNINFADYETHGWQRHHESRRLQLVRLSFRRAIELWILHDQATWLEQQGYQVTLREFCPRPLTPRNLLLTARLL